MITAEQLRAAFSRYISDDRLIGAGMIELYPNVFTSVEALLEMFPVDALAHDAFVALDPGDNLGFRAFFDRAKADGVLQ